MLPHGADELNALAAQCTVEALADVNGWTIDLWEMTPTDVDLAVAIYKAVLHAGKEPTDPLLKAMAEQGLDLTSLLMDADDDRELVSRADVAEYAAAASLIAANSHHTGAMHMPNIPKASRRKSDSGIDIFNVTLEAADTPNVLQSGDGLRLSSVKHTLTTDAWKLKSSIANSLRSDKELSAPYVASQLRVLDGRLRQEGLTPARAGRTFLFMADFPKHPSLGLAGVAVVEPSLKDAMSAQMTNLPTAPANNHSFRIITFPGLSSVHERCR